MEYNKKLFIDNVYYLSKFRSLKIRDLETACGVSAGYFARLRQGTKNIAPGGDVLLAVAEKLSVSVDSLLTFEFSRATASELEILHYLDKLIHETESRCLSWQEDPGGYLDSLPVSPDGTTPHPLFSVLRPEGAAPVIYYHTMFHPALYGLVPVKTLGCIFPGHKTLYLVQVWNTGDDPASPGDWTELELVMTGPGIADPIPLAHTSHERSSCLDAAMKRLFNAAADAAVQPLLSQEARQIIRDYLNEERDPHDAAPEQ